MNTLKRAITVLLCLSMLVACFLTGCKRTEENVETTEQTMQNDVTDTEEPEKENGPLVIYPEFDARIERDYMYSVSVTMGENTATLPVYNHTLAMAGARNPVDTSSDEHRRFSTFAFDPAVSGVRVDIKVNCDFNSYSVIPSAKNFKNEFSNGVISVYLDNPDYFMIRLDDKDSTLIAVFADAPETDIPQKGSNVHIIDGWHEEKDGVLELTKKGSIVYIKPGAVLNARIHIKADNCKVIGRGAILDPFSDIYRYDEKDLSQRGLIYVSNSDNSMIDGVHLLNSVTFNVFVQGAWDRAWSDNMRVTNLKILSTQVQSDGISFNYYNKNSYAEHCFVYCGDNGLVYEDEAHYKDILVGTLCNAIYPQTDVINSSCEDIYVFRADEGIINTDMAGSNYSTIVDNSTITNLYVMDVTYTPYFIYIENSDAYPAVSCNGGMTIKNVYLPKLGKLGERFLHNRTAGNYEVNLINLSIDGALVQNIESPFDSSANGHRGYAYKNSNESWGWIGYPAGHTFTYTTTSDFNANIIKHKSTVNYKNDLNIFVGKYQIYYEIPLIREGSAVFLALEQTQKELRAANATGIIERNGVEYISADNLVAVGMAKEVKTEGNNLIITPNYNGENLILADVTSTMSPFTKLNSYQETAVVKEGNTSVYHITDVGATSGTIGLNYVMNEAVKKYGTGTYKVTFMAKTDASGQIVTTINRGNVVEAYKSSTTNVGTEWTACTLEFDISNTLIGEAQVYLTIKGALGNVSEFYIKDISLVKIG